MTGQLPSAAAGTGVFERVPTIRLAHLDATHEQDRLRASERYYRSLFEHSHDPVLVLAPDETVLDVNDEACRVYGIPREQFVGMNMKAISVNIENGQQQMLRVLEGEDVRFATTQHRADGALLQIDVSATRIMTPAGAVVLTMNRDVTEERRREAALVESEERYRNLFEGAPIGICRVSSSGRLLAVNDALAQLLGYASREGLLSLRSVRALFADDTERRQLERDLRERALSARELRLRTVDGKLLFVQISARVAVDVIEAFVVDITARKEAEEERAHLATEVHLLLHSAYEGICATDADGRCTLVNAAAARMLGFEAAEMIGRSLHELTHSSAPNAVSHVPEECPFLRAAANRQPLRIEDVLQRRTGETFNAEIVSSPIVVDGHVRGVVSSFLDITDRIATAKRLEVAERVMGLGRVARSVAHEFNNVLMSIVPVIEILERRVTDPKLIRLLGGAKASVARGKKISQEIVHFTRQREPVRQRIEVLPYLQRVADELMRSVGKDIEIEVKVLGKSLVTDADPAQLLELFTHLAFNARDAMPDGGVLTLSASLEPDSDVVEFRVTDTGCGMTQDVQQRAFEPLFTTRPSATGMGLALVHRIIKAHGGDVFIESTSERGTSVHFTLAAAAPYRDLTGSIDRPDSTLDRH